MKNRVWRIIIGILIIVIGGLVVRVGELNYANLSQADTYKEKVQELEDHFTKEQDSLRRSGIILQRETDSIQAEYISEQAYSKYLEKELASKIESIKMITTDESYIATQNLLAKDNEPKEYGYSGKQVKEIHVTIVKKNFLDSIKVHQDKAVMTLWNIVFNKNLELDNREYLISSLESEVDSLAVITEDAINCLMVEEQAKLKYQRRSKIKNYALVVVGTGVVILTYINQKDERIN